MIFELISALTLLFVIWLLLEKSLKKNRNAPPGPFQWPIVGNVVQMGMNKHKLPHLILADIAKDYGEVMSLKLGVHNAVVLSSFESMKTLLTEEEFTTSRYNEFPYIRDRSGGKDLGMIFTVGATWKELRRFTMRNLRDFGFGKVYSMEAIMTDELNELVNRLKKSLITTKDSIFRMNDFFTISVVNNLWSFMSGTRFDLDDPDLVRLVEITNKLNDTVTFDNITVPFPILRYLAPRATGYNDQLKLMEDQKVFLRGLIEKHRRNLQLTGEPQNMIEAYLNAIEKNPGTTFNDDQLLIILADFFVAGSETTSKTLSYAILFMLLNPDVQHRVHDEISTVVPPGQFPSMTDSERMPFTKATIMEVMRLGNIVPLPPPRTVTRDYKYKNYVLPKGCAIINNMHTVFMDKIFWGNPEIFCPDRFLDKDMNFVNTERVTPFGFGGRICLGESLARNTVFIYFTTMLQNFEFQKVPNQSDPTIEPKLNITNGPYPFDVLVKIREKN